MPGILKGYKVGICSGYFDPLHAGHVEYLITAKSKCNYLIVIVNNDKQAEAKKGFVAIGENDRLKIAMAIKGVDRVILATDEDKTVCKTLEHLAAITEYGKYKLFFFKGGDRFADEIPEAAICKKLGITMMDGLGKKIDSSTRINTAVRNLGN